MGGEASTVGGTLEGPRDEMRSTTTGTVDEKDWRSETGLIQTAVWLRGTLAHPRSFLSQLPPTSLQNGPHRCPRSQEGQEEQQRVRTPPLVSYPSLERSADRRLCNFRARSATSTRASPLSSSRASTPSGTRAPSSRCALVAVSPFPSRSLVSAPKLKPHRARSQARPHLRKLPSPPPLRA